MEEERRWTTLAFIPEVGGQGRGADLRENESYGKGGGFGKWREESNRRQMGGLGHFGPSREVAGSQRDESRRKKWRNLMRLKKENWSHFFIFSISSHFFLHCQK